MSGDDPRCCDAPDLPVCFDLVDKRSSLHRGESVMQLRERVGRRRVDACRRGGPEPRLRDRRRPGNLASRVAFRERRAAQGSLLPADDRRDARAVLTWAEGSDHEPSTVVRWLAWLLPAFAAGAFALGPALGLSVGAVTGLI